MNHIFKVFFKMWENQWDTLCQITHNHLQLFPSVSIPHCCYGNSQPKHCHAAALAKHHVCTHHIAGVASLKSAHPISVSRGRVRAKKNNVDNQRENRESFWRTWSGTEGNNRENELRETNVTKEEMPEFCLSPCLICSIKLNSFWPAQH